MAKQKLVIAAYDDDIADIYDGFDKLKDDLEDEIGFRIRKQDVWLKIIRTGIKVLANQKIS
jgi:hypothetical protein